MTTTFLLALWAACAPPSPESRAAAAYLDALQPLLADNGLLYDTMTSAAGAAEGTPERQQATTEVWANDITPLAEHLRDQAGRVVPPSGWEEPHHTLTAVWTDRARAYRAIATALAQHDSDAFRDGQRRSDAAKAAEEEWFRSTNLRLAPLGHGIAQYPQLTGANVVAPHP
jgi:hypothetical protein